MSRYVSKKILHDNLIEHPAVKFWHRFDSSRVKPEVVVVLKERRKKKMGKSAVYRLKAIGPAGTNVIAKRCKRTTCMKEHIIYKDILPHLPMPTLDYFGFIEEPNGKLCWLFLEDAGDEEYLPHIPEHRTIAAQWLGLMHTTASQITVGSCLSDRGPTHYLELLKEAQGTILQNFNNPALNDGDLKVLESIISLLHIVKSSWKEVEQFCDQIPRTLVHCDFVTKNVRIRNGPAGIAIMPLDWEYSGWGAPAIDIKDLDITTYWSVINNVWPDLNLQIIQKLACLGKIFECLAAISWDSDRLKYQWVDRGVWRIRSYESRLSVLVKAAEWRI
jgi:hypothetical protein